LKLEIDHSKLAIASVVQAEGVSGDVPFASNMKTAFSSQKTIFSSQQLALS